MYINWTKGLKIFFLVGFLYGTENLKSLILMLAVVDKHIDVKTAVTLSRLEQNYQVSDGKTQGVLGLNFKF